jgi:hypothetical protein
MSKWRQIFAKLRWPSVGRSSVRERIPDNLSDEVPLDEIQKVTFFKRDELTTDLICCDIEGRERVWFFHEEAEGWDNLLRHLERLPNFKRHWYQEVVQPPLATCNTVAFSKS